MIKTDVEIINRISTAAILEACRTVTLGYAVLVQARLNEDKPPPPRRGSMQWKSEKQRRFVMMMWKRGQLRIPYLRGTGNGLNGSETLNRSYRVDLDGDSAVLMSSASYAPYVVGDQQAEIHKNRWKTARDAAAEVHQSGDLQTIADQVFAKFQP
jgi:hypothetical protein